MSYTGMRCSRGKSIEVTRRSKDDMKNGMIRIRFYLLGLVEVNLDADCEVHHAIHPKYIVYRRYGLSALAMFVVVDIVYLVLVIV